MAADPNKPQHQNDERDAPGTTGTNPAGTSTPEPAEGRDDAPEPGPGSPRR